MLRILGLILFCGAAVVAYILSEGGDGGKEWGKK